MADHPTILSTAKAAAECFRLLLEIDPEGDNTPTADTTTVGDQLARFSIWASNIGVFAPGHASLDYRLRDSPEAAQLMIQLLEGLRRFLKHAIYATGLPETDPHLQAFEHPIEETSSDTSQSSYVSSEHSVPGYIDRNTQKGKVLQSSYVSSEHSVPGSIHCKTQKGKVLSIPESPEMDVLTPSEERLAGIEQTIDRLYRLKVAIRRPAIVTQNTKAANFQTKDEEGNEGGEEFKDFAMKIVTHRFPNADESLRDRLAIAIILRRKRFIYRRKGQQNLSFKGLDDEGTQSPMMKEEGVSTVQRSSPRSPKLQGTRNLHASKRPPPSQTSASLFTKSDFMRENTFHSASNVYTAKHAPSEHGTNLQIPPPPKVALGSREFECHYCYLMIPIAESKPAQWKRHVFRDLDPYVCLSPDCSEPQALFHDRNMWAHHMQWEHARQWRCTAPGHTAFSFDSEDTFAEHMRSSHKGAFNERQLPIFLRRAERPGIFFTSCPLCGFASGQDSLERSDSLQHNAASLHKPLVDTSADGLSKHIANHLEWLSLISLPWRDGVDEETQGEVTASHHADEDPSSSYSYHDDDMPSLSFDADTEPEAEAPSNDPGLYTAANLEDNVLGIARDEWCFIAPSPYYGHNRDPNLQTLLRKLYIESSPSMDNHEGPILPCHFVSFSPNKNFFGRALALAAVEKALLPSSKSASGPALTAKGEINPRMLALCGLGGIGKTQVAIEFVNRHREKFDAIFWVNAGNASRLAQDFSDIALRMGFVAEGSVDSRDHTYTRELVKRWLVEPLKHLKGKNLELASWLLIYDGVEKQETINEFWPYAGPGSVLVTSRDPFGWTISWPLIPFTATEATDFLHRLTGSKGDADTRAAVSTVSERLGGLPLALTQMAGVITRRGMSFTKFIQAYNERESRQELLQATPDPNLPGPGYEHSLASVWALEDFTHGATLLNTLSMLASDGITERLLGENLGKVDLPGFPSSLEEYQRAKDELLKSSLLTKSRSGKKFFVHRLLQDVARTRLSKNQFRSTFMACVQMVSALWPFEVFTWRHGIARWGACEELFPHVAKLKELAGRTVPSEDDLTGDYEFARLLTDAGWYHHERGRSSESRSFNDMAQTICEIWVARITTNPASSSQHQQYARNLQATLAEITHNRGCIASETNDPLKALAHFKDFNATMEQEFAAGPSLQKRNMRLAISWNGLGTAYMLNKRWARGTDCFLRSIQMMRKLAFFQETHLSLPIVNLGLSYWLQGDTDAALEQLFAGLRERQRMLGSDDRESFITGRFLHALGNVKRAVGRREESMAFHRKALWHYENTLGDHHHRTADACVKMAEHSMRLKQVDTAMTLLDRALKVYSNGDNYVPERARALFMRSQVLRMMRKGDEAEVVREEAAELYYEVVGEVPEGETRKSADVLVHEDFDELIAFWSR